MVLLLGDAIDVDMVATDPLKENGYEFLHMYIFIIFVALAIATLKAMAYLLGEHQTMRKEIVT